MYSSFNSTNFLSIFNFYLVALTGIPLWPYLVEGGSFQPISKVLVSWALQSDLRDPKFWHNPYLILVIDWSTDFLFTFRSRKAITLWVTSLVDSWKCSLEANSTIFLWNGRDNEWIGRLFTILRWTKLLDNDKLQTKEVVLERFFVNKLKSYKRWFIGWMVKIIYRLLIFSGFDNQTLITLTKLLKFNWHLSFSKNLSIILFTILSKSLKIWFSKQF